MNSWKSKWNYAIEFEGDVDNKTRKLFQTPQINNIFDVKSLRHNSFEKRAIQDTIKATNRVLKRLSFPRIYISSNQFIILDRKEYETRVADNEFNGGKFSYGFVYLIRNKNKIKFLHDLTHEISHFVSFYGLSVTEIEDLRKMNLAKSGYSEKKDEPYLFDGLNEAATELFSLQIKEILGDFYQLPKNITSQYPEQVIIVEKLISSVKNKDLLMKLLFKSYIDGSEDFLDLMESEIPGSREHLKMLQADEKSPYTIARLMGEEYELYLIEEMKKISRG